jgi:histidine triad (HIT) family protein
MTESCLFCRIVAAELPATIVHEDPHCVAFRDIAPVAPVHVLVVPREHLATLDDAGERHVELLGQLLAAARRIAAQERIAGGYRTVINCGASVGQSVFHLHLHLLGGRTMAWPPG